MIDAPWYNNVVERMAFNAYAMTETFCGRSKSNAELESIARDCVNIYHETGRTNFDLNHLDLTDSDFDYVQECFHKWA